MAVNWTGRATNQRLDLFQKLNEQSPTAAARQDDAIDALASELDGLVTYEKLADGTHWVPVKGYPIVILYERDPQTRDATVLDLAPTRTNWKPPAD